MKVILERHRGKIQGKKLHEKKTMKRWSHQFWVNLLRHQKLRRINRYKWVHRMKSLKNKTVWQSPTSKNVSIYQWCIRWDFSCWRRNIPPTCRKSSSKQLNLKNDFYILEISNHMIKVLSPYTPLPAYNYSSTPLIGRILFLRKGNWKVDRKSNDQRQML